jgi:hypothetical protein
MFLKACYDRRCGLPASIFSASIPLLELIESVRYTHQYFINVSMLKTTFIISDVNVFRNVKKVTVHVLFMPLLQYSPLAAVVHS